ncbi:MAG: alpha/beta hydrolase [Deltaproteobacteria bacterium]|nr:alpha/beta hydrolase [Deltaproteobacteria bacterium]
MSDYELPPPVEERQETLLTGDGVRLDARIAPPAAGVVGRAVICHPHPLMGGTMENKVVVICARAAAACGYATVRFNFRGVGASSGHHGEGVNERDDVRAALGAADLLVEGGVRALVGFSFGSAVSAALVNEGEDVDRLVLVGVPLGTMDVPTPPLPAEGLTVIVGDQDSFCPVSRARSFVASYRSDLARLCVIPGADHFFHRRLDALAHAMREALE